MKNLAFTLCLLSSLGWAGEPGVRKNCYLEPCEIKGDFDGDKKTDVAILVTDERGHKGILVTFSNGKSAVLGAGQLIGNGGISLDWMNRWRLHQGTVEQGATETKKPPLVRGDAILLEQVNSASGLVYWDGSRFQWYQQGD